jgi:hypothetical protein
MASFGGVNIFGTAVSMSTSDNARANQLNAYFGLSGLESIDGGARGRTTSVSGLLYGSSPASLAATESQFRSFNDGVTRPLVDTLGTTWLNVRLQMFQPQGRIRQSPSGILFRAYKARFFHLD